MCIEETICNPINQAYFHKLKIPSPSSKNICCQIKTYSAHNVGYTMHV